MTAPLVAVPGLLLLVVGILAWWRRRRTIKRNLRALERDVWIVRPSWLVDVHTRPMEVGKDID